MRNYYKLSSKGVILLGGNVVQSVPSTSAEFIEEPEKATKMPFKGSKSVLL